MTDLLERPWGLIAFDLDDTLAPSKSALPEQMGEALRDLLDLVPVAVISGGALSQFNLQLLEGLQAESKQLTHLHLMPTCGTQYLRYDGEDLVEVYAENLSDTQKDRATRAVEAIAKKLGIWEEKPFGEIIEDRGSQITFSALGQQAPLELKVDWDPEGQKKAALAQDVAKALPDLEVRSGGSTSVDITAQGIDKAYGMDALVEATGIPKEEMLFIGDRLDEGGNDYAVKAAGYSTYPVGGWEDTVKAVRKLVDFLSSHPSPSEQG